MTLEEHHVETQTTPLGIVKMSLREFGRSITLVLLFATIITLSGRRIYHDMLRSNQVIQEIAKDRVKQDLELTIAMKEVAAQLERTNAILVERSRHN